MKLSKIKLVVVLISLIICFKSQAQFYKAGDMLSTYIDINPDTLINYSCISHYSTESYYIDINNDMQNDYEIRALCSVSPGYSSQYIGITSLNSNSYIRFGQFDSAFNNYFSFWMIAKVAKPLFYGDTINSHDVLWDSTNLYLYYYYYTGGGSIMAAHWIDTNDEYIGIKYRNATDTMYGWIRVNCPNSSGCIVKDYSIGSLISSIQDNEFDKFTIYPNPTNDHLTIESPQKSLIEILNIEGQTIKTINDADKITTVELRNLSSGVYILRIKTNKKIVTKKIIKE